MQEPVEIAFRNITVSTALEEFISKESENLDKFFERIVSCRVVVEKPQKAALPGGLYKVRIDITLPQRQEVVIKKQEKLGASYEEICGLIRRAFKVAAREIRQIKQKFYIPVKSVARRRQIKKTVSLRSIPTETLLIS